MGLIRFIQDHNRNEELRRMNALKEQELTNQHQQNRLYPNRCVQCGVQFQYPGQPRFCPNCGVTFKY